MTVSGICSSTQAMLRASFLAGITKLTAGGGNATSGGDNGSVVFRLFLPLGMVEAVVLKPSWEPLVISAKDMSITAFVLDSGKLCGAGALIASAVRGRVRVERKR